MMINLAGLITAEDKLQRAKAEKKQEINTACALVIDSGFEHNGHTYQCDAESRASIATAALSDSLPDGFTWRDVANEDVPIDGVGLRELAAAAAAHVSKCRRAAWELKAAVERKRTIKGVEEVQWPQ